MRVECCNLTVGSGWPACLRFKGETQAQAYRRLNRRPTARCATRFLPILLKAHTRRWLKEVGDAGLLDTPGPKGEPIVIHSINLALDSAPHTHPFEVIFPGTPAVQVASVVFDEARTALLPVKPVQFRVCEDTLAVRSWDASDTFLGPHQIARLPVTLFKTPLGPCQRALILDKPVRPGLAAGLKWNSCSPEWQPPFLEDRGVWHREVKQMPAWAVVTGSSGCGRPDRCKSKLSQPSPSRGRGKPLLLLNARGTAPPRGRTNRKADGDAYTPKRMG
ncbi:hypothetical protein B0H66DRAFT_633266 [Apodospora peruviana]|uniref:Uncharacterized protein n=1 Tax=Apodospora peruviana TaxID=516989 RepID=A0AAE0LYF0_9PEZI|nr:hypothetical protein B0H66DRAFT_633266 [Apodospora peruviana]